MTIETPDNITVLGKTFNSEEERRKYFREELRKKLPELKKMEGFPIGKDEDILNLSDPPFYTACPNPWLNDFITEWKEEKKELEKKGKRIANFEVNEPYAADVSEGKNNPIYNAHSYHTKVPHPAIMRYILHYTQPGDIVYDGFAGTGMTGVAASQCEKPEKELKYTIENENKSVKWGKRNSIVSDLSPIATFISSNYNTKVDVIKFQKETSKILNELENEYGWMYKTYHSNGEIGLINYTVWSDVFLCHVCNKEMIFWEVAVNHKTGAVHSEFECPSCQAKNSKRIAEKAWETKYDSVLNLSTRHNKIVPVLINYEYQNKRYDKAIDTHDYNVIDKIDKLTIPYWFPQNEIMKGDKTGEPIRLGIENIHHYYTKRALITLSYLYSKSFLQKHHSSWFLFEQWVIGFSRLNRYSPSHFSQNNRNLAGTLYIGSQHSEVSPYYAFKSKLGRVIKAFQHLNNEKSIVNTGSADSSGIAPNSVDYIFTDPPFGANLMYSELNFLWESWLKVFTNNNFEAIESKSQNKNYHNYTELMTECFKEYYLILKPGKWMTVEFSNTNAAIWNSIQSSLQKAGFVIANISALNKGQGTFNAVTSTMAVKQDLIISCYKPSSEFDEKFKQTRNKDIAVWDFVQEHMLHLPIHLVLGNSTAAIIERSPKILFDRLIAFYVQKSLPVPIDAGKFQKGLRGRFAERDGMYFTQEQVQEYDKKKAETPGFVQLSILVSSEQDGVLWLKNLLQEKPLTYQDIHPQWMQALAGVRKGDIIPELSDILEENFLDDKQRKWYVPDPEKEADLERVRNRRLLKQYEEYKKELSKPKGKIKEARVEALRAGFKQNYQDKDFKTIVQVGDRIPSQLLMEDEVLLQFYDIASSRV